MSKITPNDCPVIVPPPGTEIPAKFITTNFIGEIKFPLKKSKTLFSPVVEAFFVEGVITVNAVVYVDSKVKKTTEFNVIQNLYVDIEGDPQLQFFVCYDLDDDKDVQNFRVFEVTFQVQSILPFEISKVETIQTFLWDIDPETSRGTETTVQRT